MLDLKLIRSETERVAANLARRGADATLPDLVDADEDNVVAYVLSLQ